MELLIQKTEDRQAVAAILVKNGYTVRQKRKPTSGRGYEIVLEIRVEPDSVASR